MIALFYDKFGFLAEKLSDNTLKRLEKDLFQAGMKVKPEAWASIGVGMSLIVFVLLSPLALVSTSFLGVNIIICSLVFYSLLKLPESRKKKKASAVEKQLIPILRLFAIRLDSGQSFEECLESISREKTIAGKEFARVLKEAKITSIPESLYSMSERIDSLFVKKAISVLVSIYEKGSNENALFSLADEKEKLLQAKMKEYFSKSLFYSLLFITFSAILPSFFQSAGVIGGLLLGFSISPLAFVAMMAAGFPLLNTVILWIIISKKP